MTKFKDVPQTERPDMMWMFKTIEAEMRQLDLPSRDIAIISFRLFWGSEAVLPSLALFPSFLSSAFRTVIKAKYSH